MTFKRCQSSRRKEGSLLFIRTHRKVTKSVLPFSSLLYPDCRDPSWEAMNTSFTSKSVAWPDPTRAQTHNIPIKRADSLPLCYLVDASASDNDFMKVVTFFIPFCNLGFFKKHNIGWKLDRYPYWWLRLFRDLRLGKAFRVIPILFSRGNTGCWLLRRKSFWWIFYRSYWFLYDLKKFCKFCDEVLSVRFPATSISCQKISAWQMRIIWWYSKCV